MATTTTKEKVVPTIIQRFGMAPVKPWTTNKVTPLDAPDPGLIFGIELEIENCRGDMAVAGLLETTDGSLRNNGLEFIGSPMTYSHLSYVLRGFFTKNSFLGERNYSDRCSVHVHTNAQDLTFEQLATVLMLYQVFEGVLFNFIGNERDKNIYCVPWSETQLSYRTLSRILQDDDYTLREWQKYTALNLLPLTTQGTLEWRHMEGTCNVERILQWCRMISRIYSYARNTSFDEASAMFLNLNTSSQYMNVLRHVFREESLILETEGYEELLEDGVLNMKFSLVENTMKKKSDRTEELLARVRRMHDDATRAGIPGDYAMDWNEVAVAPAPRNEVRFNYYNPRPPLVRDDIVDREEEQF